MLGDEDKINCHGKKIGLEELYCCNYSETLDSLHLLKTYNLIWSVSAMVMTLVTLCFFLELLALKTYRTPLQRLFLALTAFSFLGLLLNSANIILQPGLFHLETCKVLGYADVSIFLISMLLVSEVALYLLLMMYYNVQGKPLPMSKMARWKVCGLEVVFLAVAVLTPPLSLVPRRRNSFGLSGPYCWINTLECSNNNNNNTSNTTYDTNNNNNNNNNNNISFEKKVLITYTVIMGANVAMFVLLQIMCCVLARRHDNQGNNNNNNKKKNDKTVRAYHKHLAKKATILDLFLLASFGLNLLSLWGHFVFKDAQMPFGVLVAIALVVPSSPVLIPVGFILFLSSTRKRYARARRLLRKMAAKCRTLFFGCCSVVGVGGGRHGSTAELASMPNGVLGRKRWYWRQGSGSGSGGSGGGSRGGGGGGHTHINGGSGVAGVVDEAPSYTVSREVVYTGAFTKVNSNYGSMMDHTKYSE